ncbi:B3 DNA binding domain [Macleaya cordata]|uniref:B3 DNA binding domain n=1 Tax=Macleaya cordata TaxID=56857 RepID=A0A200Q3Z9_MACCD|nr:B3 DNA binding domain [Macleaya cordata]
MQMGTPQTRRPSFFKVMIGDFTKKLRIPVDFIENFNGIVPVESILRSPSGRCWSINVKRVEENLFFRKGWPDFVRDHSLEFGDFLVMKYIGNSQFDVKIYGKNGCEKELPSTNEDIEKPIPLKNNEQGQTTKRKFTKLQTEVEHKFHEENRERDSVGSDKKICGSCKCVEPERRTAIANERTGTPEASCSIKTERPFFISTWMKKKKYELEIPKKFIREVGEELSDFVVLKDPAGRFWSVGLRKADGRVWFEKGWEEFTGHQSITDQHILRFSYGGNSLFYVFIVNTSAPEMEHLNGSGHKVVLAAPPFQTPVDSGKEIIDRNADDQIMKSRYEPTLAQDPLQVSEQSKEKNKDKSTYKRSRSMSPPKRPYKKTSSEDQGKKRDISDVDDSNQAKKKSENLTADFRNEGISTHSHNPMQTSSNKTYGEKEIHVTNMDRSQSSVSSGRDVGMQLNAGELMKSSTSDVRKREHSSSKVSSPCQGNERTQSNVHESVVKEEETSEPPVAKKSSYSWSLRTQGNERANQVSKAFKSKHPFFTVVLRDSYLSKGYMHIPNSFARRYMTKGIKSITLRGLDKKKWSVGYCVRGSATQLSSGWTNFTREMDLEEGDVCVFELIEKNKVELKVSIFRDIKDVLTEIWPIKKNAS